MKMKPEVKEKWVAALRSHKYRQTKGFLHKPGGGYCCLGVLCEVAIENGVELNTESRPIYAGGPRKFYYNDEDVVLPPAVIKWAGIEHAEDEYQTQDPIVAGASLSSWNDEDGASLVQIADLIEANL